MSMGIGAQVVHRLYQPLSDLEEYVEKEFQRVREADSAKKATPL